MFTFNEEQNDGVTTQLRIDGIIFQGKSEFQKIEVISSPYGRMLILDDKTQSAEIDEHVYHESLVHPAMVAHGNPKTVFIGGGGEGATAREVLRFKSVEKLTMVDIDPICLKSCKEHLPNHHMGSFDDSRMNLVVDDAAKVLREAPESSFDVIILDLADPLPDGPCWQLYTVEFYAMVRTKLTPNGIFVTQSGPGGISSMCDVMTPVAATLKSVYGHAESYVTYMASFFDLYAFTVCRNNASDPLIADATVAAVDDTIKELISTKNFHYDGITHRSMFSLSLYHRRALADEKRLITKDAGAFLYTKK